jgi:hypothetical protein
MKPLTLIKHKARDIMNEYLELAEGETAAANEMNELLPVEIKYSKTISTEEGVAALIKTDKALELARKLDQPVKKIRVFDFDDCYIC